MRARDNRHRAEELAAVVRWLRRWEDEHAAVAAAVQGVESGEGARVRRRSAGAAAILHEAAARLEQGEHHDAAR